jgi:hypothetical protein
MLSKTHEYKKTLAEKGIKDNQCIHCCREFNSKTSLWRHKQQCGPEDPPIHKFAYDSEEEEDETANKDEVIDSLQKQNDKLQNFLMSMTQNMSTICNTLVTNGVSNNQSHNNHSLNTTNNQTFNINYFLNERCKDAIDICDFIQGLDYSQEGLKKNAHLSYPERITKQIREGLGNYKVEDRPIHCSDAKRQKLYIKHNGEWVTEYRFNNVVSKIGENNTDTFREWVRENPNCQLLDTCEYEQYMKMYLGNLGPASDEQEEKYSKKIIGGIIDEIRIDKEKYAT